MPGNEISMTCTSTTQRVKEKWAADIEDGTYSIGINCAPKEVTVLTCRDGGVSCRMTCHYLQSEGVASCRCVCYIAVLHCANRNAVHIYLP